MAAGGTEPNGTRLSDRTILLRWPAAILGVGLILLFADLPTLPMTFADESRLSINAMEMRRTGLSLVTTYGFHPDLWNTKPPLMIWLMYACSEVFGPHPWALRIPSVLATLGSAAVTIGLSWRVTRSVFVALAAAVLLLASRGFAGQHTAQTADYDALMCLFTTGYCAVLFLTLSTPRPRAWPVLLAGALVAGAVMTKGIAGLMPGAGIAAYLVATGRWTRPLRTPWYVLAGLIVLAVGGGFYLLREHAAAGYLDAVWNNEIGGRFGHTIPGHDRWVGYYLVQAFVVAGFSLGPFALLLLRQLKGVRGRRRALARFSLWLAAGLVVVLSISQTKIRWYIAPAYPFLAIACAIALDAVVRRLKRTPPGAKPLRLWVSRNLNAMLTVGVVLLIAGFVINRYVYLWPGQHAPAARYGRVFHSLYDMGERRVLVVDEGVYNAEAIPTYAPQMEFNALVWAERGLSVGRVAPAWPLPIRRGDVVVSCDSRWTARLTLIAQDFARTPGCVAVRR